MYDNKLTIRQKLQEFILIVWHERWYGILVHDLWYYLKCRFWKKYNRIIVKTLPPTWNDRDELMAHVMFQILRNCRDNLDWTENPNKDVRQQMDALLDWWDNTYLAVENYVRHGGDETKLAALKNRLNNHKRLEDALQEKLVEIIKIRRYLWS